MAKDSTEQDLHQEKKESYSQQVKINLSAPWEDYKGAACVDLLSDNGFRIRNHESIKELIDRVVQERTRIHEVYIHEQEKTRRLSLVLSFIMIIFASASILFAPEGRETLSYWIGGALLIFAAGASGYTHVIGRAKNTTFEASRDNNK